MPHVAYTNVHNFANNSRRIYPLSSRDVDIIIRVTNKALVRPTENGGESFMND